ncbi:hypothetical protein RaK2_00385 [Klebsiella phage vB_KleM_RaK2]|uniref:Uncharacterized protein n=1 Tax=Klebsiella phage vB_KleM_RaK2 TaxID=1147094 RepID=H6X4J2_9CAUD|nr:hypothetical protein F403_gp150 [Klebsiella phage vB_KleM_RaK2]AFA44658.1 hypothetical protein RaK2_00385 [Klebsiella phage vB_KleM_RaK2]
MRYKIYKSDLLVVAEYICDDMFNMFKNEHDFILNLSTKKFKLNYYGSYELSEHYSIDLNDCTQMQDDELFQYSLIFYFNLLSLKDIVSLQKEMLTIQDDTYGTKEINFIDF